MPAHYAAQAELPTGQKSSYEKAPPHNSVQTAQDEPVLHQPVYCMLFLQVSGAHLQPLPVTWCRNLTAILRSASQFEPRSSTIHIPLLCQVKALKQNKQMVKDKKVADYTCILPTMLCITKKKLISSEGHVRARDSAHTAGFSQSGQGFLMTSWKVIWWTQETRLLAAVRWHKPAAYESNTPFLCFPWGIPRRFRMIE